MPATLYGSNLFLDTMFGQEGEPPAIFYVAATLEPASYLVDGDGLNEPSGGGYSRVQFPNDGEHWHSAADGYLSNLVDIIFPAATAPWGQLRHWALCDAATSGNVLFWGVMTARLIGTSGILRLPTDALMIRLR
jgi:hypothetical protein